MTKKQGSGAGDAGPKQEVGSDNDQPSATSAAATQGPIAQAAAITEIVVFTKNKGALSKRISLAEDGSLIKDGSECRMATGHAERVKVADAAHFAEIITGLTSNQAIALGALRHDLANKVKVSTKDKLKGSTADVIARTQEYLTYTKAQPAFVLLDYDTNGMPADVAEQVKTRGGFWEALVTVTPGLKMAARVMRRSTSAGLSRADTKEALPGSDGWHGFVLVQDGTDSARFLTDLHARAWLAGLGWMLVGKAGQFLERSIVDRMVGAPERLVFEGAPILVPPLAQDTASRAPTAYAGAVLDTLAACPPLTPDERRKFYGLKAAAIQQSMEAAAAARAAYVETHAQALATRTGMDLAKARDVVAHQCRGMLLADVVLQFDDKELGDCTVGNVLDDPARFKGRTLADPIEGIAYGRCKAKVMVDTHGTAWINSFAHGGAKYALEREAPPDYLNNWHGELGIEGIDDKGAPTEAKETQTADNLLQSSAEFVAGYVPPDYLIDGLLQRRYIYAMTAPTGSGKTCIALRLAAHVALGLPIGGMEVERGRVLYFAGENPDDVRARWVKLCEVMQCDPTTMDVFFLPGSPPINQTRIREKIDEETAKHGPFSLLIVDTSAAYFQGDEENNNSQLGDHARMLRSFAELPGGPTVLVTCHPTKTPDMSNLLPRGGGAFLAEIDGNLVCLYDRGSMVVEIDTHGKFRGPEFAPFAFQLEPGTSDKLKDAKGRSIWTVIAKPITQEEKNAMEEASHAKQENLLRVMEKNPAKSLAELAELMDWRYRTGMPDKSRVQRLLVQPIKNKLVEKRGGRYVVTPKGVKHIADVAAADPM